MSSIAADLKQMSVQELKELLSTQLQESQLGKFEAPENLKRPEGIPTGLEALDNFLFWGGLPMGALSLFSGALGTGATSLFLETASTLVNSKRWVAWVNREVPLSGLPLYHKGMNLERFITIEPPANEAKLFWVLQEVMSSQLFDLIGCDLGTLRLKEHQIRKLQTQARQAKVALVFFTQTRAYKGSAASVFSLIMCFEKRRLLIERALHRPVPHSFARSVSYARFTRNLSKDIGITLSSDCPKREPHSLPETSRTSKHRV